VGRFGFTVVSALAGAVAAIAGLYAIGLAFRCGAEYAGYVTLLGIIVVAPIGLFVGGLVGAIGYPMRRLILIVEGGIFIVALAACTTMQTIPNFVDASQMQCNYE
jgi:hypothetical protein